MRRRRRLGVSGRDGDGKQGGGEACRKDGRGAARSDSAHAPVESHGCAEAHPLPGRIHQSTIAEPQVNPEPKATSAIFMPRLSAPLRSASASRIGMVAAVVFP